MTATILARRISTFLLFAALCCARDRALLVGVGDYPTPIPRLPGIDLDIASHTRMLGQLGFAPESIRVISNRDATIERIRREMRNWLASGSAPEDRIVFYFSGHGSLVEDTRRRVSGVLIPFDTKVTGNGLANILTGEELGSLLSEIHSNRILVVIDACHSGHLTDASKGVGIVPKFFDYRGVPASGDGFAIQFPRTKGVEMSNRSSYLLLAASRRNEIAGATVNGSLLTLALVRTVGQLLGRNSPVTLDSAHPLVTSFVLQLYPAQHPEISGDTALRNFDWSLRRHEPSCAQVPQPEDWKFLGEVYSSRGGDIRIGKVKPLYKNAEAMELEVDIPSDGFLNIVTVGQRDSVATVLFPNAYAEQNHVKAGMIRIPDSPAYRLNQEAGCPEDNEVLILFSTQDVNLFREGVGTNVFKQFGEQTRGTVVRPGNGFLAGFANYRIVP
jgi:hypothetical protein